MKADDSHKMSSFIFSKNNKTTTTTTKLRLSSVKILLGTLKQLIADYNILLYGINKLHVLAKNMGCILIYFSYKIIQKL